VEGRVKQKKQKDFMFFTLGIHLGRPERKRWVSCSVEIKEDPAGSAAPFSGALQRQPPQPAFRPCQLRHMARPK
jgi:hypothetical protein